MKTFAQPRMMPLISFGGSGIFAGEDISHLNVHFGMIAAA